MMYDQTQIKLLVTLMKSEPHEKPHTHSVRISAYCIDFNHKIPRFICYVCVVTFKFSQKIQHLYEDVPEFSFLSLVAHATVVSGRVAGRGERCALHNVGV